MKIPPVYFEDIRRRAKDRWDQLEADPELAGPWRLLFQQVQSPRHVVSELLQNADDAQATKVTIAIEGDHFRFRHDGADFKDEEFASLCRFGFSNKRNLHTIGFRGIGFKSTFSLGNRVELHTPTLSVQFNGNRFSDPVWIPHQPDTRDTCISVPIQVTADRITELRKSLREWEESCASLLFFRHVRELSIEGRKITCCSTKAGPVENSFWMELSSQSGTPLLVVRSQPEPFPPDAIEEIRQERNVSDFELPPCHVEIVLGLEVEQRLYVVLPTGVKPDLPFSCNAPFLQDPARLRIKDPSISPTNRWLLQRIGKLATETMLAWLNNSTLSIDERAQAYSLLPKPSKSAVASDESQVIAIVTKEFQEAITTSPCILTDDGRVLPARETISLPRQLHQVWDDRQLTTLFSSSREVPLSRRIHDDDRANLSSWKLTRWVTLDEVVGKLISTSILPPRPNDWAGLATLWNMIESDLRYRRGSEGHSRVQIVPVEGSDCLFPAERVVRLAGRNLLPRAEDWEFLSKLVTVVDSQWLDFIGAKRGKSDSTEDASSYSRARDVLSLIGLDEATSVNKVIAIAGRQLFDADELSFAEPVLLAHIAAALDAEVPASFCYLAYDEDYHSAEHGIVFDPDGQVADIVPPDWRDAHIMYPLYGRTSPTCDARKWRAWALSSKSRLYSHPPLQEGKKKLTNEAALAQFLKSRNAVPPQAFHYRSRFTLITDYDFDPELVHYWEIGIDGINPWQVVAEQLLLAPPESWRDKTKGTVHEVSSTGNSRKAQCDDFTASWVMRLARKSCLMDNMGNVRTPTELLMRTPDTEPLMGVEVFIKAELDTPDTKPLLRLLGVRDSASSPDQIINRIRALATLNHPPMQELTRWYDALDRLLPRLDTSQSQTVRTIFQTEKLILTSEELWASATEVYHSPSEQDVPHVPILHPNIREFSLWNRVGVEQRPSMERVLAWLSSLPTDHTPLSTESRRVRAMLAKFPLQVWETCGHWLSLDGSWVSIEQLQYRLATQGQLRLGDLHADFRARVADLRDLDPLIANQSPFVQLTALETALEYQVVDRHVARHAPRSMPWLTTLGHWIARIKFDDETETSRVQELGRRMSETIWHPVGILRVTLYAQGTPVGTATGIDAIWQGITFHAADRPLVRMFNSVASELARPFNHPRIADAIRACLERDAGFIEQYFQEAFTLLASVTPPANTPSPAPQPQNTTQTVGQPIAPQQDAASESLAHFDDRADSPAPGADAPSPPSPFSEPLDLAQQHVDPVEPADDAVQEDDDPEPADTGPKVSFADRFLQSLGFRHDGTHNRHIHESGDWIARCTSSFNYERYDQHGNVVCRYWVSDQSLWNGGVEINAELWELIKSSPAASAIGLRGDDDEPRLLAGHELVAQVDQGQVRVFPAKYRLRMSEGEI